jgi:hypothetical protein
MYIIRRNDKHALFVALIIATCVVTTALFLRGIIAPMSFISPSPSMGQQLDQHLAVPFYIDPATDPQMWERLASSEPGRVGFVVANVDNGPAEQMVPAWTSAIRQTHDSGIRVLGYVDTGYLGELTAAYPDGLPTRMGLTGIQAWEAQINSDVEAWYELYGPELDGIFFDQAANECGPTAGSSLYADAYATLSNDVKLAHPRAFTALNPGTAVPRCFESAADVLVTFEGSYTAYTATSASSGSRYQPLSWSPGDPYKIWHIVYDTSSLPEMDHVMALAKSRKAGYVYVTDDVAPNPYQALPPAAYWVDEQIKSSPYGQGRLASAPGRPPSLAKTASHGYDHISPELS